MTQTGTLEIDIANEISPTLFIRKTAIELFKKIEQASEAMIVIDFKSVVFLNRTFAHEYLKQKDKSRKYVSEIHLAKDIEKLLFIVERARLSE